MNDQQNDQWGERLAAEGAAAGTDQPSLRRLLGDAVGVVKGRLGEVSKAGSSRCSTRRRPRSGRPPSRSCAPATPDLSDDEVARRLIDRAAKTAAGLALLVGGVIAAQRAVAVASAAAPPAAGTAIGSIGVTALAEVLALFVLEAKLRADLGALAGQPLLTPRELAANVLGDVQAAGGWKEVRGRSLRLALPDAAARRAAARLAAMVPARFARIVLPEIIAPLIGSAVAARLASRQVRAGGEQHWGRLRTMPQDHRHLGPAGHPQRRPARPAGWHPSGWGPPPGDGPRQLPPPPDR